jgi:hypothetical protein
LKEREEGKDGDSVKLGWTVDVPDVTKNLQAAPAGAVGPYRV